MSKIIKAQYVVKKNIAVKTIVNNEEEKTQLQEISQETLSQKAADNIYQETKQMIEELMLQAHKRADEIILKAKEDAQKIVENSTIEVERIQREAYENAYKIGYDEGITKSNEELDGVYTSVLALAEGLRLEKVNHIQENKKEIIELIFSLTEKIVNTVIDIKPEIINNIIGKIVEHIQESEKIIIKVNSLHMPFLNSHLESITKGDSEWIRILEDDSLEAGDCVVLTETGNIENIVVEQVKMLKETLLEEVANAGL